jgi:exonuclease 3'-5' domain-containing protein 1
MASPIVFVDTLESLAEFLSAVGPDDTLYLDLEGKNLCRHGTLDLVTVLPVAPGTLLKRVPLQPVYIISVHKLGAAAFDHSITITTTTSDSDNEDDNNSDDSNDAKTTSFRAMLECPKRSKVFWDVRNDSDALFSHFAVSLRAVVDVQLWELVGGSRPPGRRDTVCGLEPAIRYDAGLGYSTSLEWSMIKRAGVANFSRDRNNNDVFSADVLSPEILAYCANDVRYLPALKAAYHTRLAHNAPGRKKVDSATRARVAESQSADYEPNTKLKILSPWASASFRNKIMDEIMVEQMNALRF